jgi:hypothetical protein
MGSLEPQADNSQYLSVPIGVRTPHRFTVRIVKTLKYREHFWVRFAKIRFAKISALTDVAVFSLPSFH